MNNLSVISMYCIYLVSNDGGNINREQWLRLHPKPIEAKLNIVRRKLSLDPNIQRLDPIIHYILPVMCHNKPVLN